MYVWETEEHFGGTEECTQNHKKKSAKDLLRAGMPKFGNQSSLQAAVSFKTLKNDLTTRLLKGSESIQQGKNSQTISGVQIL